MAYGTPSPGRTHGPVEGFASGPGGVGYPLRTEGVLGRRLMAYLVDLLIVALLTGVLALVIGLLGILTFGLGWGLYALLPLTAIVYSALTVGGPSQATPGMRMLGLRVIDALNGGRVGVLQAAVHALLFYVAAGTFVLWLLDLVVGFARSDRRLGHDLLTGFAVLRR